MPEKTKPEKDSRTREEKKTENHSGEKTDERGNWSDDQREKSYYYDDAYGYEIYKAEDEDEETSEDLKRWILLFNFLRTKRRKDKSEFLFDLIFSYQLVFK